MNWKPLPSSKKSKDPVARILDSPLSPRHLRIKGNGGISHNNNPHTSRSPMPMRRAVSSRNNTRAWIIDEARIGEKKPEDYSRPKWERDFFGR